MKLLTCVKQVPEPDGLAFDEESGAVVAREYRMNRFDEYAVETALQLRQRLGAGTVEAITWGPESAAAVLKRAVGMGADQGIHLLASGPVSPDPFVIAAAMADYAASRSYDLILAGVMAEDTLGSRVGPMIAAILDIPCATSVIAATLLPDGQTIELVQELEAGEQARIKMALPALLTVQTSAHSPRYPSLSNLVRASKTPPVRIESSESAQAASRQAITRTAPPQMLRQGRVLEGTQQQKARALLAILREKGLIR